MTGKQSSLGELRVFAFIVALNVGIFWDTLYLPPGSFEPLGSAAFPRFLSIGIGALSLLFIARGFRLFWISLSEGFLPQTANPNRFRLWGFVGLAFFYTLAFSLEWIHFTSGTFLFLASSTSLLVPFTWKRMIIILLLAVSISYGCQYAFTQIFIVDLP